MAGAYSCPLGRVMHRPGLLNQSDFVPAGHLATSRDIHYWFSPQGLGRLPGIPEIEPRDAARYPTVHRTVPPSKELPAPSVARRKSSG